MNPTDKPAQSDAPSAREDAVDFLNDLRPVKIDGHRGWKSLKDGKEYLMADILTAYAALRTAQQRDQIANEAFEHYESTVTNLKAKVAQLERELLEDRNMEADLHKRLAAAESALSEARERTIQYCNKVGEIYLARGIVKLGDRFALDEINKLTGDLLREVLTSSASAKGE